MPFRSSSLRVIPVNPLVDTRGHVRGSRALNTLGLTALALSIFALPALEANTELNVPNGTTDLTSLGATSTSDLTFTNMTYSPAAFTAASNLSLGTLDDLDSTSSQVLSISGAGTITLNGGSDSVAGTNAADLLYVTSGGTLNVSNNIALTTAVGSGNFDIAGTSTLSGVISGTGFGFTKTGAGTLTLSNTNTFTGGLNINAGTIVSTVAAGLGAGTATIGSSSTLNLNNSSGITVANALSGSGTLNAIATANSLVLSGTLSGFTGTVNVLTTGNGKLTVASSNPFGSAATINIGSSTTANATGAVNTTSTLFAQNLTLAGDTFNLYGTGNNEGYGALRIDGSTLTSTSTVDLLSNSTIGNQGGGSNTATIACVIAGSGFGFSKVGNGIVALTGANTYTGTTTVSTGTLSFAGTGSAVNSAATDLGNQELLFNAAGNGTATTTRLASVTLGNTNGSNPGTNGLVVSNTGNSTATTDAISGNITLSNSTAGSLGVSNILFAASATAGASETLTANGLTQQTGAVANVYATAGTLGTNAFFKLSNAPAQIGAGGTAATFTQSVVPWIYSSNNGVETYDATNGLIVAATTPLTSGNTTLTNTSFSGGTLNLAANTTVNSLNAYNAPGTLTGSAGTTLTINSGVLYASQAETISVPTIALSNAGYFGNAGRAVVISSVITGSNGITFFDNQGGGVGTTTLSGPNTYTGVTNVDAGGSGFQLILANQNALLDSTLNLTSGSIAVGNSTTNVTALNLGGLEGSVGINLTNAYSTPASVALTVGSDGDSTIYSGVLANGTVTGGSLTIAGMGTLALTGSNAYTGATTINSGGTLQLGAGGTTGTLSTSSAITDNGTLAFNRTNAITQGTDFSAAAIAGTGGLTQAGSGTTTLNASNTFTGVTSINAGTVSVNAVSTGTNAQPLGENSGLNLGGASTVGTLLYTGGSGETLDKNITLGAAGGTVGTTTSNSLTLSGTITGSSNLTVNDSGGGITFFSGASNSNSFTGNLIIVAGPVRPGSATPFNVNNTLSVQSGASFNFGSSSFGVTFAGLNDIVGATGGSVTGGSNSPVLTLAGAGTYGFSGTITTGGSLVKSGTGTQTLSGADTFSGATTIGTSAAGNTNLISSTANGGILNAAGNGALGSATTGTSSITVNNGGTLLLSGATTTGTTPGGVYDRVKDTAGISLGTTGGTGVGGTIGLSGTGPVLEGTAVSQNAGTTTASPYRTGSSTSVVGLGALTLTSNSTLNYGGVVGTLVFTSFTPGSFKLNILNYTNTTTNGSTISGVDGTDDRLIFEANQQSNINAGDFTFNGSAANASEVALDTGFYEIVPVPEPRTWAAGLLCLGGLGFHLRRRQFARFKALRVA